MSRTREGQTPRCAGIRCAAYYLPPALSLEAFASAVSMPPGEQAHFRHVQGLTKVHIAGEDEGPAEMAIAATRKLLLENDVDPCAIDAVVVYHTVPFVSWEPNTLAGKIQAALGLTRAYGFSVNGQNCASPITALRVARNMVLAGSAETVLLVGTDYFMNSLRREIRDITIQGEGASAALIQAGCERNHILETSTYTDGGLYGGVSAPDGAWEKFNLSYYLNSQRVIRSTLKKLGLTLDDIRVVIPHNTNLGSWRTMLAKLGCPEHKLYSENIARHGHVCSSDLVINLADVLQSGRVRAGDYMMMFTVGLGTTWGCAVLRH